MSVPVLRPPLVYYGGKQRLAPVIAQLLPAHNHYVEPFAGSLSVLFAKPRSVSRRETVNDLDGNLMAFWTALRDYPEELQRLCEFTPHGRAQRENDQVITDDLPLLERARRVWSCLVQGRSGSLRRTGWRYDADPETRFPMTSRLDSYRSRMPAIARRLRHVSLEADDALTIIERYDGRGTLFYVDPPYLGGTRTWNYGTEMVSSAQHRELAALLRTAAGTVILSGYASSLYEELYEGWYRYETSSFTTQGGIGKERTEVIWSNHQLETDTTTFRNAALESNETPCQRPGCYRTVNQSPAGRPRMYCSNACKTAAHRQRQAGV
ncbi:DNA adenine methylase [Arthrobacter bambusae]